MYHYFLCPVKNLYREKHLCVLLKILHKPTMIYLNQGRYIRFFSGVLFQAVNFEISPDHIIIDLPMNVILFLIFFEVHGPNQHK